MGGLRKWFRKVFSKEPKESTDSSTSKHPLADVFAERAHAAVEERKGLRNRRTPEMQTTRDTPQLPSSTSQHIDPLRANPIVRSPNYPQNGIGPGKFLPLLDHTSTLEFIPSQQPQIPQLLQQNDIAGLQRTFSLSHGPSGNYGPPSHPPTWLPLASPLPWSGAQPALKRKTSSEVCRHSQETASAEEDPYAYSGLPPIQEPTNRPSLGQQQLHAPVHSFPISHQPLGMMMAPNGPGLSFQAPVPGFIQDWGGVYGGYLSNSSGVSTPVSNGANPSAASPHASIQSNLTGPSLTFSETLAVTSHMRQEMTNEGINGQSNGGIDYRRPIPASQSRHMGTSMSWPPPHPGPPLPGHRDEEEEEMMPVRESPEEGKVGRSGLQHHQSSVLN
mgnify:CR=1 FL=1